MSSKAYFDRIAGQWDTMQSEFFPDAVREKAVARATVVPGSLAADLGAGLGFITRDGTHREAGRARRHHRPR